MTKKLELQNMITDKKTYDKLVETYGGTRLFVPKKMSQGHHLAKAVGLQEAIHLSAMMGGCMITIPRGSANLLAARNNSIISEYSSGAKVKDIARKFGLTERRVYSILKG
ncbi:MAG: hypothetical protein H7829_17150 [Magnetococcus sp. THC-1_WYH]